MAELTWNSAFSNSAEKWILEWNEMSLKEAFAYQLFYAGIEYKINKLGGEYKLVNARNDVFTALILGPDSWLYALAKRIS